MRPFPFRSAPRHRCPPATLLAVLLLTVMGLLTRIGSSSAADLGQRLTGDPNQPWQISADTVDYDAENTTYHARGNVVIEKASTRLVADAVAFNRQDMTASASGHVLLTAGSDVLSGERLDLNLAKETGVLHGGTLFLSESHFYIRGQRIEKTGPDTYRAERASVTTCDGESPDWIITGRKIQVTVDGYGKATHAVFKARSVPVLYTPYLLFPLKTKRQTGLLMPEFGYSDRLGFYWDQPFFWAINDSSDATVYVNPMTERGTMLGMEYRYALSEDSFGAVMADGLKDRRRDDGREDQSRSWGYTGDAYDRPNSDRYWLRAKANQQLPFQAMAHLDLDIVSDQDYLQEFRSGPNGYDATRDYFLQTFGREIDTYDENIRTNRLNVNRIWSHYSLNGDLLWNDNVALRRWSETDDTLQQMPVISFDGTKQRIFGSGAFWDLSSEYTYFYREDGDRGHRTDIHPRTYLPLKWKNYLSIEPSAGFRQTTWIMDRWADESLDQTSTRQIPDFELDLSSEIARVMGSPVDTVDRIRHSIRPQVVYTYIPQQDQSDLPYFTSDDRIAEANRITYSLTNTFIARMPAMPAPVPPDGGTQDGTKNGATQAAPTPPSRAADAVQAARYHQFCRIYLEQSYDIAAARENDPEPFSDVYGELNLNLGGRLIVDADATYAPYASRFSGHNVLVGVTDSRGDRLSVEHRYTTSVNESIRAALSVVVTERLTVRGEYQRNLLDEADLLRGIGFLYQAQCWSFDLFLSDEGGDKSVALLFSLAGIGEFGR